MLISDIIFQSGEFYGQSSKPSVISQYGPLIAAVTAIALFYAKIWYDRREDKTQKERDENNALSYFVILLESAIKFSEKQAECYGDYSKRLIEKPLEYELLEVVVGGDLDRILTKLDHERILRAYIRRFGNDKKRILKFQTIFSRLDLISQTCEAVKKTPEKHSTKLTERLTRYIDLADEKVLNRCSSLADTIRKSDARHLNNPFYLALSSIIKKYIDNGPKLPAITYLQEGFILPLAQTLDKNFRNHEQAMQILIDCGKAIWLYNDTVNMSKAYAEEMQNDQNSLKKAIGELKESSADLF